MSVAANLWTTYGVRYPGTALTAGGAGIRENVSDALENIDPDDHATVGLLPKTTVNNLFSDWMVEGRDVTSTAAAAEGAEFSAVALKPRSRIQNWVQRFRKDFALSLDQIELARRGGIIGVKDAMGHEAGLAGAEILRNVNVRLWCKSSISATASAAEALAELSPASGTYAGGTATAITGSQMGNLRYFMQGVQWVNPGGSAGASGSGTLVTGSQASANVSGAISTAGLYALHEAMFNVGINPNKLFLSPGVKSDLSRALLNDSGLGLVRTLDAVKGTEYGPVVDIIRTDFGRLATIVDRWIPQASATAANVYFAPVYALMDTSKVRLAYWRQLKPYSLPPSGDNMRAYMQVALTLEVSNPNAIGYGLNVTT